MRDRCHVRDYGGDPWGAWLGCSMPKARLAINIYIYGTGLSHGCVSRCQYSQYIQCIHTLTVKHAVYARFCAICAHTELVITQRPTVQPAQTKRSSSQYIYRVGDAVLCLPPPARSDDCYRTGVLRQAHDGAPPSELGEGSIRNRRNRRNGETYGLVYPAQSVRLSHTYNIL